VRGGNSASKENGSPERQVVGGLAELGNDIATLLELQLKLTWLDLKEAFGQALIPLIAVAVGFLFILGALPVAILGLAQIVATAFKLSVGVATLLTGVVVLMLAATILFVAVRSIGPSFSTLRRSREEFERNTNWIRTVLLYSGRGVSRRRF